MKTVFSLLSLIFLSTLLASCNNSRIRLHNRDVNIAYTDTGQSDTTILFVHGWCINKSYWASQASYFGKRYRVVAIDLPGFGQSGKNRKEWNTMAFSRDVDSVIKQLDLKKVILVGHSMSGDITLQAAVDNPKKVIGLVVVDIFKNVKENDIPSAPDKKAYADAIDSLRHNFTKIAFDYFKHDLFYKTTPVAIKKRVLDDVAKADPAIAAACMEYTGFDEMAKLKQLKAKLYLINSDTKPTDTNSLTANNIPFKLLYIHATGHFPMVEKPEEFNALLNEAITDMKRKGRLFSNACLKDSDLNIANDRTGIFRYVWPSLPRTISF